MPRQPATAVALIAIAVACSPANDAMAYEKRNQYRVGNTATGGTRNIPTAVVF